MRYKLLGRSGLRVSELCLGTMTFGEDWGWGASKDESRRIFDTYAEAGGNFLDTANRYTEGSSERLVGEFVAAERERFVVATKYSLNTRAGDPNGGGNHRKNMVQAVEASLKRLNTDYIDLYWLHVWDAMTPVEEIMRALDDLVRAGKVLYVGISDTPAWRVSQANTLADLRGWSPFVALQIEYSLIERTPERDLIPMARAFGLSVTPWSPLGQGVLSGKYNTKGNASDKRLGDDHQRLSDRNLGIAQAVVDVAAEIGHSPSQVALAWLRAQGPDMIPILGARKLSQFEDNLACLDVALSTEQLGRLNGASAIEVGFPHDFLSSPMLRDFAYGGTYDLIDQH